MLLRQGAIDRTKSFEDFVEHFYLDTNSKVTVGFGRMLPDPDAAAVLPLTTGGKPATDAQKQEEYGVIAAKEPGHLADWYAPFTTLKIARADAEQLLKSDLNGAIGFLAKRFAKLDDYPESAQDALLDMMFNIGSTKFTATKWPQLFAAVIAQNWKVAAQQSNRPDVPADRNQVIKALFEAAAAGTFFETALNIEPVADLDTLGDALRQALTDVTQVVGQSEGSNKLFPGGVSRIDVSVRVGTVKVSTTLMGPDRPSEDSAPR